MGDFAAEEDGVFVFVVSVALTFFARGHQEGKDGVFTHLLHIGHGVFHLFVWVGGRLSLLLFHIFLDGESKVFVFFTGKILWGLVFLIALCEGCLIACFFLEGTGEKRDLDDPLVKGVYMWPDCWRLWW